MRGAIFLDRDNTLIKDKGYTHKLVDLEFLPGTFEGLKKLQKEFLLIVITNQEGIPMGYFKPEDYEQFKNHMHYELRKNGVHITSEYHCPHLLQGNVPEYSIECNCKKPKTGMFEQAQKDFDIDFSKSWMIGDKISDINAGKNIGAKTVGIPSKESTVEELKKGGADFVFNNLSEAADFILGNRRFNGSVEVYPKVWGEEHWITNNEKYCGKKMLINEGFYCSYHMHKVKEETFYVLQGELEVIHEGKYYVVKEGETFHVKPREYHSFRALQNTVFFEFSTQHFDEDNYRLTKSSSGNHEHWKNEIKNVISNITQNETKIKDISELKIIAENLRHQNKRIVTTNGTFDVLHAAHINLLKKAKSQGDVLIVLLNSDSSVKKNKGQDRPIIPERERAEMLASLDSVDHVIIFDEDRPLKMLEELKPHIHVKGGSWDLERIEEERNLLETWSGKLKTFDLEEGYSTTNIIEKILKTHK